MDYTKMSEWRYRMSASISILFILLIVASIGKLIFDLLFQ